MNSSFASPKGLSGLSDNFSGPSRVLAKRLINRKNANSRNRKLSFADNLDLILKDIYKWHPHKTTAIQIKPYLDGFNKRSDGVPRLPPVFRDLLQRYPNLTSGSIAAPKPKPKPKPQPKPKNNGSNSKHANETGGGSGTASGGGSSPAGNEPATDTPTPAGDAAPQPKQAGTNWLGWAAGLAALSGAAWYFMPGDKPATDTPAPTGDEQ